MPLHIFIYSYDYFLGWKQLSGIISLGKKYTKYTCRQLPSVSARVSIYKHHDQ